MSFDTAACTAWLGAKVTIINVETALPTRLVKLLVDAFDASRTAPRLSDAHGPREQGSEAGAGHAVMAALAELQSSLSEIGARIDGCGKRLDRLELGGDGGRVTRAR